MPNEKIELIKDPTKMESVVNPTPTPSKVDDAIEPEETEASMWNDLDVQLDAADEALEKDSVGEIPPEPTPVSVKGQKEPQKKPEEKPKVEEPKADETPNVVSGEVPTAQTDKKDEVEPQPKVDETPTKTPEEMQKEFAAARNQVMEQLEKTFALDEETADKFLTAPQEVVPKLAARLFLDVYESVMRGMHQSVPAMMQASQAYESKAQKAETDFYGKWPMLKNEQYQKTVLELGSAYRRANPNASTEDFITNVGAAAVVALRLPYNGIQEEVRLPAGMQQANQTPAPVPGGKQPTQAPATQKSGNAFTDLSYEFDAEEDD